MSVVRSRVPILLIHGLADTSIPYRQSEMISVKNSVAVKLWEVPNAGHTGASDVAGREFIVSSLDGACYRDVVNPEARMENRAPQSQKYTLFLLSLAIACTIFFAVQAVIEPTHKYAWLFFVVIGLAGSTRQYLVWYRTRFFKS